MFYGGFEADYFDFMADTYEEFATIDEDWWMDEDKDRYGDEVID